MPATITNTIILNKVEVTGLLVNRDKNGVISILAIYDVLDSNGAVYKHATEPLTIPLPVQAGLVTLWNAGLQQLKAREIFE